MTLVNDVMESLLHFFFVLIWIELAIPVVAYAAEHPVVFLAAATVSARNQLMCCLKAASSFARSDSELERTAPCLLFGHGYRLASRSTSPTPVDHHSYAVVQLWTCERCETPEITGAVIDMSRPSACEEFAAVLSPPMPSA